VELDADPTRARVCLVHLVRAANELAPLRSFLESYRDHSAGVDHNLVLAMKGFESRAAATPALDLAHGLQAEVRFLADEGLDIDSYAHLARELRRERYCFMNSYCTVLADDWLAKLDAALSQPTAGLVGATGSWASPRSQALYARGVPSAYRAVFPDRKWMNRQFRALRRERSEIGRGRPAALRDGMNTWRATIQAARSFPPFPSPHLRTNAFMISGHVLARLRLRQARRKLHAYQLESGRNSITRQILRLGLRVLVVDAQGTAFEPDDWHESKTFWQHDQERLLVADNQTEVYDRGDRDRRAMLARYAWGLRADPAAPGFSRTNTDV
jgi:hypothetical protein